MLAWCEKRRITFTRSRPYRKNDNCFVEQKNWPVVRQQVGYLRYDTTEELEILRELGALYVTAAAGVALLIAAWTGAALLGGLGGYAAFNLGYGDNPFGPGTNEPYELACPSARWVRIVLPNTNQFGTASFAMAPCEGRMNVSAIFPGADWVSFQ